MSFSSPCPGPRLHNGFLTIFPDSSFTSSDHSPPDIKEFSRTYYDYVNLLFNNIQRFLRTSRIKMKHLKLPQIPYDLVLAFSNSFLLTYPSTKHDYSPITKHFLKFPVPVVAIFLLTSRR